MANFNVSFNNFKARVNIGPSTDVKATVDVSTATFKDAEALTRSVLLGFDWFLTERVRNAYNAARNNSLVRQVNEIEKSPKGKKLAYPACATLFKSYDAQTKMRIEALRDKDAMTEANKILSAIFAGQLEELEKNDTFISTPLDREMRLIWQNGYNGMASGKDADIWTAFFAWRDSSANSVKVESIKKIAQRRIEEDKKIAEELMKEQRRIEEDKKIAEEELNSQKAA